MAISVFAPGKINLSLHITGRRADGYHLLDSLVVFADVGDRVTVAPAEDLHLTVTGPQAGGLPSGDDNLVMRAARAFSEAQAVDKKPGAAITLEKLLPVASGMGGGSADAAATLRALARMWNLGLPDTAAVLALGADVPVCLASRPARMRGIGERMEPLPALPALPAVLINPRVPVSTPAVFKALMRSDNPAMPDKIPAFGNVMDLVRWLADQRNDLQAPAKLLQPVIGEVLQVLETRAGCLLARMSGSGASCFGLFTDAAAAHKAAATLRRDHPDWWITAAQLGDQGTA